jgi:hypothetical protein
MYACLHIGRAVACTQNQDIVQLQIGYHVLEGKRMPLKKPMAIMDKVQEIDSEGNSQTMCKVWGQQAELLQCRMPQHAQIQQVCMFRLTKKYMLGLSLNARCPNMKPRRRPAAAVAHWHLREPPPAAL